jgi:hypothetical protein
LRLTAAGSYAIGSISPVVIINSVGTTNTETMAGTLDLGVSDVNVTVASVPDWTAGSSLTVANLSNGTVKLPASITNTPTLLAMFKSAENPTYVASVAEDGTLSFAPAVVKSNQTITFNLLPSKTYGDSAFTISATASSDLPVSFTSSDPLVASVSGTTVTINGAGTTTITASQAGDATYNAAPSVTQDLVVAKADQTITFEVLASKQMGDPTFNLSATASSGLAVSYSSGNTGVATISGNMVTLVGTGSSVITASQAGNSNCNPASNVTQTLVVTAAAGISDWLQGGATNAANLGKYAIGGATNLNAASETPVSTLDTNKLSLSAIVRTNDNKLVVVGEVTGGLTNWTTNGVTMAASTNTNGVSAGCQRQVFSVDRTNSPTKQFLRLKATYTP